MIAKLIEPCMDKNWSLQFFNIPGDSRRDFNPVRANIWFWCRHFGEFYKTHPFLQGDSEDWMMIEFWTSSQSLILEACLAICNQLNLTLEME
ncbi:MAG: hypothetical protein Q7R33_04875 [Nitrosarchaeum sp.]|nr:hypothetical protein [Nitrosarchaeum sp.]